jgi:hypothetical protein
LRTGAATTIVLQQNETIPRLKSSNFNHIEIIVIFAPNVSSRPFRRNKSFAHETIFRFSRRHPETWINYQSPNETPLKRRTGS